MKKRLAAVTAHVGQDRGQTSRPSHGRRVAARHQGGMLLHGSTSSRSKWGVVLHPISLDGAGKSFTVTISMRLPASGARHFHPTTILSGSRRHPITTPHGGPSSPSVSRSLDVTS
ncbi:hypothetical protein WME94_00870 [Sorangium sp. So ce429]